MYLRKWQAGIVCLYVFSAVFFVLAAGVARAEYPDKPITLIVPWPPAAQAM